LARAEKGIPGKEHVSDLFGMRHIVVQSDGRSFQKIVRAGTLRSIYRFKKIREIRLVAFKRGFQDFSLN
jgi:hypothetical protein